MNKFNAIKHTVGGITFDSKKEAAYYSSLLQLRQAENPAERVVLIERQTRYDICIKNKYIGYYKADFRVAYADGKQKVVDVKGYKKGAAYSLFRLKKKLVEAIYDIEIIEV